MADDETEQRAQERASTRPKSLDEVTEDFSEELLAEMLEEDERLFEMKVEEQPKNAASVAHVASPVTLENEKELVRQVAEWGKLPELQRSQVRRVYAQALEYVAAPGARSSFNQVRNVHRTT